MGRVEVVGEPKLDIYVTGNDGTLTLSSLNANN